MSPTDAEFNGGCGFDFMPWATADGDFSNLDYSPGACLDDKTSYGNFTLSGNSTSASSEYRTSSGSSLTEWPGDGCVSATPYSAPPATYSAGVRKASDPDTGHYYKTPVSPISPVSSSGPIKKRHSIVGPDDYQASESSANTASSRPAKRACSDVSEHAMRGKLKAKDTTPPSPFKAKPKAESKSKPGSKSKASKSARKAPLTPITPGESPKAQLRTACRRPKPPSPAQSVQPIAEQDDDALTPEERRARQSHNLVEKQYRNRLNQQFESLLAVLPADNEHGPGGGIVGGIGGHQVKGGAGAGDDRRLSKAEVLEMARQRIRSLEQESLTLQQERNELLENVGLMRDVAARQVMGKLPGV